MIFRQLNTTSCKTYLIGSETTNESILIDPVLLHVNEYASFIKNSKLKLTGVIDTHTHADHISGAGMIAELFGVDYIMHQSSLVRCVNRRVSDGYLLKFGDASCNVLHTPGHTPDSICLVFEDKIFTGDTLFLNEGGAGRTDLPGGNPGDHWESLQKIIQLPGHLTVYPAHEYRGREPSFLENQKKNNPYLQFPSKESYIKWQTGLKLGAADWMKDVLTANSECMRDPNAVAIPRYIPACEVMGTATTAKGDEQIVFVISAGEIKRRIAENQLDNTLILDVREPSELKEELGAIEGAYNIPVGQIEKRLKELEKYKRKTIITVCRSGARSFHAATILMKAGFKNVFNMEGGMMAFRK